jgi:hypothetical protein
MLYRALQPIRKERPMKKRLTGVSSIPEKLEHDEDSYNYIT